MRIRRITEIPAVKSRCISVDSPEKLFRVGGPDGVSVVTHNSVVQRSIVFGCIMRPDEWRFLGIDLKMVELSEYRQYAPNVLGIATNLEDATTVLRFASQVMMDRYAKMESVGAKKFDELAATGENTCRLMVMVDEATELMDHKAGKSDEIKAMNEMADECNVLVGSIARLGRAAGVYLVLAMQRPDAKILGGEIKNNLGNRVAAGNLNPTAAGMVLDDHAGEGTKIPSKPPGRTYVKTGSVGVHGQGIFTPDASILNTWWSRNHQDLVGDNSMMSNIRREAEAQNNTNNITVPPPNNSSGVGSAPVDRSTTTMFGKTMKGEDMTMTLGNEALSTRRPEDDWDDVMQSIHDAA